MTQPAGADMSHRCLMETERINGSQNSENHFSDFDWKPILLWEQSPHLRESSESCRIPENCFSAFLYLSSKRAVCTCFVPAVKPSHASVCTDWSLLNSILVPFWISLFENRMNEKREILLIYKNVYWFFSRKINWHFSYFSLYFNCCHCQHTHFSFSPQLTVQLLLSLTQLATQPS